MKTLCIAAIMAVSLASARAETPFEKCQINLIVMGCALKAHGNAAELEACVKRGGPSDQTRSGRARWCTENGSPPS
jgi:hypothetical protein